MAKRYRKSHAQHRQLSRGEQLFLLVLAGSQFLAGLKILNQMMLGAAATSVPGRRSGSRVAQPTTEVNPLGFFSSNQTSTVCPASTGFVNSTMLQKWPIWNQALLQATMSGDDLDIGRLKLLINEFTTRFPSWCNDTLISQRLDFYQALVDIGTNTKRNNFADARKFLANAKQIADELPVGDGPLKTWVKDGMPGLEAAIALSECTEGLRAVTARCTDNQTCIAESIIATINQMEPYFDRLARHDKTLDSLSKLYILRGQSYLTLGDYAAGKSDLQQLAKLHNYSKEQYLRIFQVLEEIEFEDIEVVGELLQEALTYHPRDKELLAYQGSYQQALTSRKRMAGVIAVVNQDDAAKLRQYIDKDPGILSLAEEHMRVKSTQIDFLWYATEHGSVNCLKLLVEQGLDPRRVYANGVTLLQVAATVESTEIVNYLLTVPGINLDAVNSGGDSALARGVMSGNVGIVRSLLAAGAAVNTQNLQGESPLHIAATFNRDAVARLLLEYGADRELRNSDGLSPHQMATLVNRHALAKLIQTYQKQSSTGLLFSSLLNFWPYLIAASSLVLIYILGIKPAAKKLETIRVLRQQQEQDRLLQRIQIRTQLNTVTKEFMSGEWEWIAEGQYRINPEYKAELEPPFIVDGVDGVTIDVSNLSAKLNKLLVSLVGADNIKQQDDYLYITVDNPDKLTDRKISGRIARLKELVWEGSPEYQIYQVKIKINRLIDSIKNLSVTIADSLQPTDRTIIDEIIAAKNQAVKSISQRYTARDWYLIVSCENFIARQTDLQQQVIVGRQIIVDLQMIAVELRTLLDNHTVELTEQQWRSFNRRVEQQRAKWLVAKQVYDHIQAELATVVKEFNSHQQSRPITLSMATSNSSGKRRLSLESANSSDEELPVYNAVVGSEITEQPVAARKLEIVVANRGRPVVGGRKCVIRARFFTEPLARIVEIDAVVKLYRACDDVSTKKQLRYGLQFYCLRLFEKLKPIVKSEIDIYRMVVDLRDYFMHWQFNSESSDLAIIDDLLALTDLPVLLEKCEQNPDDKIQLIMLHQCLRGLTNTEVNRQARNLAENREDYYAVGEYAKIIQISLRDLQQVSHVGETTIMLAALIGESWQKLYEISQSNDVNSSYVEELLQNLRQTDIGKNFFRLCSAIKRQLGHADTLQLDPTWFDQLQPATIERILEISNPLLEGAMSVSLQLSGG